MSGFSKPPGPIILPCVNLFTALTGVTTEAVLGYINIPGGILGVTGFVEIDALYGVTGSAGTWVVRNRHENGTSTGGVGGNSIQSNTITAGFNVRNSLKICNLNSLSAQRCLGNALGSFTANSTAVTSMAQNTANPWTISVNGIVNNAADSLSLLSLTAWWVP